MGTLTVEMSKGINVLFSLCKCKFQVSFSDSKWNYSSHLVLSPGFIWSPSFFYGPSFMYLTCAMPKRLLIITIAPIRWALYAIYYDTYFLWIFPFYSHKDSVILILQMRTLRLKWVPTNLEIWLWQLIWVIPTAVFSGLNMDPKLPSRYFRDGLQTSLFAHPWPQQSKNCGKVAYLHLWRKGEEADVWGFLPYSPLPFSCAPCCTELHEVTATPCWPLYPIHKAKQSPQTFLLSNKKN